MALVVRRWAPTDTPSVRHIVWTTPVATCGSLIPEPDAQAILDHAIALIGYRAITSRPLPPASDRS